MYGTYGFIEIMSYFKTKSLIHKRYLPLSRSKLGSRLIGSVERLHLHILTSILTL